MPRDTTLEAIDAAVADLQITIDWAQAEAELINDLGLDSFSLVALALAIEDATGSACNDEQLASVRTVAELLEVIDRAGG